MSRFFVWKFTKVGIRDVYRSLSSSLSSSSLVFQGYSLHSFKSSRGVGVEIVEGGNIL
jgi:hypothetical protein